MRFHRGFVLAALVLFAIEVVIALFVRDRFVRPYLGDVLAVILVHCGLRAVTRAPALACAAAAFAVGALVELGQLIGILDLLGWRGSPIARVVLGTGFEAMDFVAYGVGALIAIAVERRLATR